jgi:NADPH2:quinone reductase
VRAGFNAGDVLRRRLTLTGSTLRPRPVAFKAAVAQALRERVWPWLDAGRIRPVIHAVLPAARAADAHALMEQGEHVGKILLDWSA